MSEEQATSGVKTPWHLWAIGTLAVLWNGMGAFDYLMTQTENEAYMSQFTPEQLEFFHSFPTWVVALWALAVWGGLLAAILLLLRKRFAVEAFLVAFVCMVITAIRNFFFADALAVSSGFEVAFSAVIFVFAFLLYYYALTMRRKGVLV